MALRLTIDAEIVMTPIQGSSSFSNPNSYAITAAVVVALSAISLVAYSRQQKISFWNQCTPLSDASTNIPLHILCKPQITDQRTEGLLRVKTEREQMNQSIQRWMNIVAGQTASPIEEPTIQDDVVTDFGVLDLYVHLDL